MNKFSNLLYSMMAIVDNAVLNMRSMQRDYIPGVLITHTHTCKQKVTE